MEGIPRPNVTWSRAISAEGNFTKLFNSTDIAISEIAKETEFNQNRIITTLEVRDLLKEDDEGQYQCLAVNNVENFIQTSDRSTAFLTVYGE